MAKCDQRKSLPIVSKFLPQDCVFYRREIHELNKNYEARLQEKKNTRKGDIEEVGSCHSVFRKVSLGNINGNKPPWQDLAVELNNETTKSDCLFCFDRKHKNFFSVYRSEVLLFDHIYHKRKPLFGNRKQASVFQGSFQ